MFDFTTQGKISGGKFSHFDMIVNSLMISMGAVECDLQFRFRARSRVV